MRRYSGKMCGDRYLGNIKKNEVHDLDNEQTSCKIDEIINAGLDKPFTLLSTAQATGYDNCAYCLGGSKK